MVKARYVEILLYVLVAGLSLLLALWISTAFLKKVSSTEQKKSQVVPVQEEKKNSPHVENEQNKSVTSNDSESFVDLTPPSKEKKEKVPEFLKEFPLLQKYVYDGSGRRNPFLPYASIKIAESSQEGPVFPLQQYDLSELKLRGILWDVKNPKAMFEDPTKEIHLLGKDDRIGRNNGYIAVIREGEVVVVEPKKIRGELVYTTRVIKIDQ